jgi:actin-related protein 8
MSAELKTHMRLNKRRVLPNSKEMVVNYNRRTPPDTIPEHNDPMRIEWTELPADSRKAPEYITGKEALRIPDNSKPRYKLYWPIRYGWVNEQDYDSRRFLYQDIQTIIEDAVKSQLGLAINTRGDWTQYSCVFIIPDLYDKTYVTGLLNMGIAEFGFARVCFFQESLAASFGAGYTTTCIVDIGAQKTSICCVEEGMCVENSRVNLKYGGQDVTDTFVKMLLFDHFPYADVNLKRRYDYLLAEELKQRFCTMNEADVSVQLFDFHLRASGQDTRKYTFKAYDEVLLAPLGFFKPAIFDGQGKLDGRRKLVNRSYDIYDGKPNDPTSQAQAEILTAIAPTTAATTATTTTTTTNGVNSTNGTNSYTNGTAEEPNDLVQPRLQSFSRLLDGEGVTPRSSIAGSPVRDLEATPAPDAKEADDSETDEPLSIERRDDILPVYPLHSAILTSIIHAARSSPQKTRDFLGGIMLIGGSSSIPGLAGHLEEALQALQPGYAKDVMIGRPPRELDAQVVVWKGGSVFGRMARTNDSW